MFEETPSVPRMGKRHRLHDEVIEEILTMIRRGELKVDQRLPPEPELSAHFGVSRGTLRAAVQELTRLGFLEVRQGDGTYVRSPDNEVLAQPFRVLLASEPQLAHDLLQLRRLLEPEVAKLAALHCTKADAEILRRLLVTQKRSADKGGKLAKENLEFHNEIARIANNTLILNILDMMHALLREQGYEGSMATETETVKQHRKIVEAIVLHNPEAARDAMIEHLEWVDRVLKDKGISI